MAGQKYRNGNNSSYMAPNDENPEIGQIQAKGPSEEGRRPVVFKKKIETFCVNCTLWKLVQHSFVN